MHRGIDITRLFPIPLSRSLASFDAPNNDACTDPTTIAAAAHLCPDPPRQLR
jgi:hypothetical protein